jgi:hypothetical protein
MTREEILARIQEIQRQLGATQTDPLHSHSEGLAISAPLLRELSDLQDQLKQLERRP